MKELKKSTRREPVSRKKNTAEKKEQTAKKSTKKNTGKALNENQTMTENVLTPTVWIDVPMPVDYVDIKLIKQFEKLQPFGKGNEKPVFADRNLTVRQSAVIGKNKNVLRCQLESEHGKLVTAIRFKLDGQEIPEVGRKISMVYYPDINEYNGIVSIQFRIEDWRYV